MKEEKKRKFKKNARITIFKCIRCGELGKTNRNHARYDTHLCCAQDSLDRKAAGFKRVALKVSEKVLVEVLEKMQGGLGNNPLGAFKMEIVKVLRNNDRAEYWQVKTSEFILSYRPNARVKCFELYLIEEKYLSFEAFVNEKTNKIEEKKRVLKNWDALTTEEKAEMEKKEKERKELAIIRAKDWGFLIISKPNKEKQVTN